MKGQKLHELQAEHIEKQDCLVCGKATTNFYGRWREGVTCKKTCDDIYSVERETFVHPSRRKSCVSLPKS